MRKLRMASTLYDIIFSEDAARCVDALDAERRSGLTTFGAARGMKSVVGGFWQGACFKRPIYARL